MLPIIFCFIFTSFLVFSQEMEQSMNMLNPNHELPDVSEFMTKLFSSKTPTRGGGGGGRGPKGGVSKRR